jgi:hypothetical protein
MDTLDRIRQCAAGIPAADLLMTTAKLFTDKSTEVQTLIAQPAYKDKPTTYKHLKQSHELGALFEAIVVQLKGINPNYTTYRTGAYRGAGGTDPEPIVGDWRTNDDCYEKRLAKVVLEDKVYKSKRWSDLSVLHADIIAGVSAIISNAVAVPKTVVNGAVAVVQGVSTAPNYNPAAAGSSSSSSATEAARIAAARGVLATGRANIAAASGASSGALSGMFSRGAEAAPAEELAIGTPITIKASGMKGEITSAMQGDGTYEVLLDTGVSAAVTPEQITAGGQAGGRRSRRRRGKGKRGKSRRA